LQHLTLTNEHVLLTTYYVLAARHKYVWPIVQKLPEGYAAIINCNFNGHAVWKFNNLTILGSKKYIIVRGYLLITLISRKMYGIYSCYSSLKSGNVFLGSSQLIRFYCKKILI